jgi:acyl-CoA thioester hydrolase
MSVPFTQEYRALWRDMDFNQHMANAAFLDYAANTRFLFLESEGITAASFTERQIGPVVLEDHVTYRREIRLLEAFTVDHHCIASTDDGHRFKLRNRFSTADGLCAVVESVGVWFDLAARKTVVPPDDLRAAFSDTARDDDFVQWE